MTKRSAVRGGWMGLALVAAVLAAPALAADKAAACDTTCAQKLTPSFVTCNNACPKPGAANSRASEVSQACTLKCGQKLERDKRKCAHSCKKKG
jgi:hypothetical protein